MKRKAEIDLNKDNYSQYLSQKSQSQKSQSKSPPPECIRDQEVSQNNQNKECNLNDLKVKLVEDESRFLQNYVSLFKGFDCPQKDSQDQKSQSSNLQNEESAGSQQDGEKSKSELEGKEETPEIHQSGSQKLVEKISEKKEQQEQQENREESPQNQQTQETKKVEETPKEKENKEETADQQKEAKIENSDQKEEIKKDNQKQNEEKKENSPPEFGVRGNTNVSKSEQQISVKPFTQLEFTPLSLFQLPLNQAQPFVFKDVQLTSPDFKKIKEQSEERSSEEREKSDEQKIVSPVLNFTVIQEEHAKKSKEEQLKLTNQNTVQESQESNQNSQKSVQQEVVKIQDSRIIQRIPHVIVRTHDETEIEYSLDFVKHESSQFIHIQFRQFFIYRIQNGNIPYSAWVVPKSQFTLLKIEKQEIFKIENFNKNCIIKFANVYAKYSYDTSKVPLSTIYVAMNKEEWSELERNLEKYRVGSNKS